MAKILDFPKFIHLLLQMFGSTKICGKMERKIKNRLKIDKLFLFITSNSFCLF